MTIGECSVLISMAGTVPYAWRVVKGHVRPERVTWFVWSVILATALWGYHGSGGNDSTWFLVGDFIATAGIFLLSLWRGAGGHTRLDNICLCIALVSLGLAQLSHVPVLTVAGALLADWLAVIPTLAKALQDPASESSSTFWFSAVAALCGIVAVGEWNLMLLFYPCYLFLANFTTALVVGVGRYQLARLVHGATQRKELFVVAWLQRSLRHLYGPL